MTAPTIDPAQLTADVTANRLAELVAHYADHTNPGLYDRDTWDEMVALAAAWRERTGWDDEQDLDRNETALQISDGSHDGLDPTADTDADWAPILAGYTAAPAEEGEWVGWPNSVKVVAA